MYRGVAEIILYNDRACGYINTGREVYLPSFWGACRDGARCDPAADQGWTGSSSCARAHRRQVPLHPDARKLQRARELYEKKEMSVAEIMTLTGFASRYSFYKYVVHEGSDALSTDKKGKRPNKTEGRDDEGREKK